MSQPPRLLPDQPFPEYSYVPGRWPHPHSDPRGHHYDPLPGPAAIPVADDRRSLLPYLLGIDLWNHGYYWEAHELWESLWHACSRRGPVADCFKGLIQLAVAGVKVREGRRDGVVFHAGRAAELFASVRQGMGSRYCLGLDLEELTQLALEVSLSPPASNNAISPVHVVFDWYLRVKFA